MKSYNWIDEHRQNPKISFFALLVGFWLTLLISCYYTADIFMTFFKVEVFSSLKGLLAFPFALISLKCYLFAALVVYIKHRYQPNDLRLAMRVYFVYFAIFHTVPMLLLSEVFGCLNLMVLPFFVIFLILSGRQWWKNEKKEKEIYKFNVLCILAIVLIFANVFAYFLPIEVKPVPNKMSIFIPAGNMYNLPMPLLAVWIVITVTVSMFLAFIWRSLPKTKKSLRNYVALVVFICAVVVSVPNYYWANWSALAASVAFWFVIYPKWTRRTAGGQKA